MQFEGEHLLPGQIGHFFVLLAFVASIISTIAYFTAGRKTDLLEKRSWLRFARLAFITQLVSAAIIFATIFYICSNHYFEYMYAYKHASKELESKYLLACIWEGQEGSFLLWTIWHSVLGIFIIFNDSYRVGGAGNDGDQLCPVLFTDDAFGFIRFRRWLGSSPFTLTRNEVDLTNAPRFLDSAGLLRKDYLTQLLDGVGLNVLLRNYWMVIHPPVLFLGFASTIIPFAFAYAGIQTKRFGDWVTPALPWALLSACVLGVGIMMGGKWAYESLSFGGYWAWDPVENASLVPWLILIASFHTMVIYKATGHSLRASYLFAFLTFIFILYSTFLTRTGILGDTSVHAFTDAGMAINVMILLLLAYLIPSLVLFFLNIKKMPSENKEERTDAREFWMFIGSLTFFLAAMFIIAKTSVPVYNKIFGTKIAPAENVEFSYNKVTVLVAIIIGLLSAVTQYFKYKKTGRNYILKKIAIPTVIAAAITALLAVFYPITYYKMGAGFLGAVYMALFAVIFSVIANGACIWLGLNGKLKTAGGIVTHLGFALMLTGILISSGNKQVISDNRVTGLPLPFRVDPKENEDPSENLTLVREEPTRLGDYLVTYHKTSATSEKEKTIYHLSFEKKKPKNGAEEKFSLEPEVYMSKEGMKASNPDTRHYLTRDIFTYISFVPPQDTRVDTSQFKIYEMQSGDTAFYKKGFFILNKINTKQNSTSSSSSLPEAELEADLTYVSNDSMRYRSFPKLKLDSLGINYTDDTIFAKSIFVHFAGVTDNRKVKIGIKSTDKIIDFITLKAYIFPFINLVWLGLIIMAIGLIMSAIKRAKLPPLYAALALIFAGAGLFYMFLLAN